MNGYLSTSVSREVAEMYAEKPTPTSDKLSILLEIECDVEKLGDIVIFAYIASQSNFRDEWEVLFDIGTTFQLTTSSIQNNSGVWHLKMVGHLFASISMII
jgi:GTP-sensing pleiotropic transcriptional regulator CodY